MLVKVDEHSEQTETVKSWMNAQWPKNINYKTTHSSIYLANLNASIKLLSKLHTKNPQNQFGNQLAIKLYLRYRIIGDFQDAIAALHIISETTQSKNPNASSFFTQATILSGFHHFNAALTSLEKSQLMGMNVKQVQALRDEIKFSLGDYSVIKKLDLTNITYAKNQLIFGELVSASRSYRYAEQSYNGSDPFQLVWIQLQQGIALLRYKEFAAAKVFFEAAHNRFPEYYLATEHLAETEHLLGNLKRAEKLYQKVSQQTNNPDFYAQLSYVQKKLGLVKASKVNLHKAQIGFDSLVSLYPRATGDHAVQFYLQNKQKEKALTLAQENLQNRKNIESYVLLITAAIDSKQLEISCNIFNEAKKLKLNPVEYSNITQLLSNSCQL